MNRGQLAAAPIIRKYVAPRSLFVSYTARAKRHYSPRNLSLGCVPEKVHSIAGINQRISPLMHIDDFYAAIIFAREPRDHHTSRSRARR